jgi:hypothetical protein
LLLSTWDAIADYNAAFTSWTDSPDAATQEALKLADKHVLSRHTEALALARDTSQAFSGTGIPATAGIALPPSLTERWPRLARDRLALATPGLWPIPSGDPSASSPIVITFLYPVQVNVDLAPYQVTPLQDLELFGVTNISNINVVEFKPQVVADDVAEAAAEV